MGARTWIKIYCDKWLEGSIRKETPAVRCLFTDLLALCGSGEFSDLGQIKVRNGVGFSKKQLGIVLGLNAILLKKCLKRLQQSGRITIDSTNILTITNWKTYQSEYERTKKHRTKSTANDTRREREYRLESIECKNMFDTFYDSYPKKRSKGQALKTFLKINPDEQLLATMLATIERAKKSADWLKEDGRFIPYPATWLNAKGWEDEIKEEKRSSWD